jgi:hypothetical protein
MRNAYGRGFGLGHATAGRTLGKDPDQSTKPAGGSNASGYHIPMHRSSWRWTVAALVATAVVVSCGDRRDPIRLEDGTLIVENHTSRPWRNVVITVNDHFRGGAAVLAARGRLTAPLSEFQTANGQRYDRARQSVNKVEVTATDQDGKPVKIAWDGKRLPQ